MASLADLGAREVIERVRNGDLRAEQLVATLLERQHRFATLRTLTWIGEQRALEDARQVDRGRSHNVRLGALAGLPLLIKDNIAVAGAPNAAGTIGLSSRVPHRRCSQLSPMLEARFAWRLATTRDEKSLKKRGGGCSWRFSLSIRRN